MAYWHCQKDYVPDKWSAIVDLYDRLIQSSYTPGAILNRIYAVCKTNGRAIALEQTLELKMNSDHLCFVLLAVTDHEINLIMKSLQR